MLSCNGSDEIIPVRVLPLEESCLFHNSHVAAEPISGTLIKIKVLDRLI
jgi:hypothetical protein